MNQALFQSKKTKKFLLLSGIAAFFLAGIGFWALSNSRELEAQTPAGQITVEGKIELTPSGDLNKNGEVDAGDTVALTFRIRNLTDKDYLFTKLITGVDDSLMYDVWNIHGAASLSEENNTISFPNLLLPAHSKQFVTIEATIKYFTEGEQHIVLAPQLLDKNGNQIGTIIPNNHADRRIAPWVGELPAWVIGWPEITPEIVPTPTATPIMTLEPGPTLTPEPTAVLTPIPGPTLTPEPSTTFLIP